jgi:hypothetical protein
MRVSSRVKGWMTPFAFVLAMAASGCATLQPNPQVPACLSACLELRRLCLLAGAAPDQVAACDADHQACLQPCRALPAQVPAASEP